MRYTNFSLDKKSERKIKIEEYKKPEIIASSTEIKKECKG